MNEREKKEEEMQRSIYEFQFMQQEMKNLEQQATEFDERRLEMQVMKQTIDEIRNNANQAVMVPLGAGVFMQGSIVDDKRVFVNVGAGIVVKTPLDDAKTLIDKQIEQVSKNMMLIDNSMVQIDKDIRELAKKFQQ